MTTIALLGYGCMGQKVHEMAQSENNFDILFAIDNYLDETNGFAIPIIKTNQFAKIISQKKPDVIIDFSRPDATMEIAPLALQNNINMVVCTTGFTLEQRNKLKTLADNSQAAFLLSPNITPGINILMLFTKIANKMLNDYDIQIIDYHFKEKHDTPSGTALKLARDLESDGKVVDVYGVRAGNIVGVHSVLLAGKQDQIEITHQSYSKDIFAKSALNFAMSLVGKKGYLEMKDILNYKEILQKYIDEA